MIFFLLIFFLQCAVTHWLSQIISFSLLPPQASCVCIYGWLQRHRAPHLPSHLLYTLFTVTCSIEPFNAHSDEHKAGRKMSINMGWMLTSAFPVQYCVYILLTTSHPLICILISHWVHCLCIQGHSGFTALGCFYVKMMTQEMFSWHRAKSALAKLDIQSNS